MEVIYQKAHLGKKPLFNKWIPGFGKTAQECSFFPFFPFFLFASLSSFFISFNETLDSFHMLLGTVKHCRSIFCWTVTYRKKFYQGPPNKQSLEVRILFSNQGPTHFTIQTFRNPIVIMNCGNKASLPSFLSSITPSFHPAFLLHICLQVKYTDGHKLNRIK